MENTSPKKTRLISKILSKDWLSQLSREEIEQEELIQQWQHPELDGYQGLLSFNELLYKQYAELKRPKTSVLKKNTPAEVAGVSISTEEIIDLINSFDPEDSAKISILIYPALRDVFYGEDNYSTRKLAEKLCVSKSSLDRLIQEIRTKYSDY
jgi:hypothetical protein